MSTERYIRDDLATEGVGTGLVKAIRRVLAGWRAPKNSEQAQQADAAMDAKIRTAIEEGNRRVEDQKRQQG